MAIPKLSYFDLEYLGEPIRLTYKISGVNFEDNRVSFADWPAFKEQCPNGQMPVLEIDGKKYTQTFAILRMLGNQNGMYPSDAEKQYDVDEIIDLTEDVRKLESTPFYVGMRPERFGYEEKTPEERAAIS